jgi:hypothetical protein
LPADKQALLAQPGIYLSFEITETDTKEFRAPKDALTDKAHRTTKTAKFEIPLTEPMPDACPPGTTSTSEAMEQGRCIGWTPGPLDDAALEAQLKTGKLNLPGNPNYVLVEFSIDEVSRFRYRDTPTTGFATETTTTKGKGLVYMLRSGMLLCDIKKLACNLSNAVTGYVDATDLVTTTKTSDVPGIEATTETSGPALLLPSLSNEMERQLTGFTITLPQPITKTLSGPASDGEGTVTVKLTFSPKPAPIPVPKVAVPR